MVSPELTESTSGTTVRGSELEGVPGTRVVSVGHRMGTTLVGEQRVIESPT